MSDAIAVCKEDCSKPVLARGLCSMHYNRWWRNSDQKTQLRASGYGVVDCKKCGHPLNSHSIIFGCPA